MSNLRHSPTSFRKYNENEPNYFPQGDVRTKPVHIFSNALLPSSVPSDHHSPRTQPPSSKVHPTQRSRRRDQPSASHTTVRSKHTKPIITSISNNRSLRIRIHSLENNESTDENRSYMHQLNPSAYSSSQCSLSDYSAMSQELPNIDSLSKKRRRPALKDNINYETTQPTSSKGTPSFISKNHNRHRSHSALSSPFSQSSSLGSSIASISSSTLLQLECEIKQIQLDTLVKFKEIQREISFQSRQIQKLQSEKDELRTAFKQARLKVK